jgi:hypothetical protein
MQEVLLRAQRCILRQIAVLHGLREKIVDLHGAAERI